MLQVVRRAVEATHTVDGEVPAVSSYHVAVEIRATYPGFAIATDDTHALTRAPPPLRKPPSDSHGDAALLPR